MNKKGEEYFKVEHKQLEFDKNNIEEGLISFAQYLNEKYHPLSQEEYDSLEQKEKSLEEMNTERKSQKIRELCDIVEANHAGSKFKRMFEDMRKKLRVDEKIQVDLNLKLDNTKLDEKTLNEPVTQKFNELNEDADRKEKFRTVFRNSYHNLIISFFNMLINLKKIKQDFAIVFRFFGHDESDIEELVYEYNCFCDCLHPRYCGDYGYNKIKFDVEKDKKDFRINTKTQEFMGVSYRGEMDEDEKFVINSMKHPSNEDLLNNDKINLNEFYNTENNNQNENADNNNNLKPEINTGYKDAYLSFMGKLTQNCTFCILDDYNYYLKHENKHGKLLLVDPYDIDTLQIFFDVDLHKNPDKIDIINVVTKKNIPLNECLNKFVVNVEPYRAIIDINYFNHKIEECVNNRKEEIIRMQGKQTIQPIEDENFNIYMQEELKKMPGDLYLKMTVLPLLHNALNMCEIVRPSDPIAFISNFMLINKGTNKTMEDLVKEIPKYTETEDIDQELLLAAGDYSREEKNEAIGEEQQPPIIEENKDNGEIKN